MRGLKGKTVLVTGGGSGIGRAISVRFAQEGSIVGIFDINLDGARETVDIIEKAGGKAICREVNIADYEVVKSNVVSLEAETGSVDILVNNAGWDQAIGFLDTDPALWKKVIDINYYGPIHMHYAVLPGMVERGGGKVVSIASDAGRVGSSGEAVYAGCKAGVIALTKTLAREFATANINLNVVCPGPTDTPLLKEFAGDTDEGRRIVEGLKRAIPMRRIGQPEDYPGIVAFLASDDADFITGQTISVSGGLTMHG